MTDLEISKALAIAIGWEDIRPARYKDNAIEVYTWLNPNTAYGQVFDYRYWTVSAPIAEKFNVFPYKADEKLYGGGWLTMHASRSYETPQKAIAMAVIRSEF